MFYPIANNRYLSPAETLEAACIIAYRHALIAADTDIILEIIEEADDTATSRAKTYYHFNPSWECIKTATGAVVWRP